MGGNPAAHVNAEMQYDAHRDGSIEFTRWMRDLVPPPNYVKVVGFKGRVDRWQEFELVALSLALQFGLARPDVGTGPYEVKREGGFQFRLFHASPRL